jgi:hypothetical protein
MLAIPAPEAIFHIVYMVKPGIYGRSARYRVNRKLAYTAHKNFSESLQSVENRKLRYDF